LGETAEPFDRYTVRSVARAIALIDLVSATQPPGLSLSELARGLEASKSATLALVRTLVSAGYIRDTKPGPRYTLGTAFIRLGDIAGMQLPLGKLCRPILEELSRTTTMTSRVAVSDGGFPVFIDRVDGPGSVRFHAPLGQREIPYASAAGKAILATLPEEQVRRVCMEAGLTRRTAHTITDIATLLDNLVLTRGRGFALDDEEDAEGVLCAAAAFFDHGGSCAGAVSVTGIKGDLTAWRIEELGRTVRLAGDRISKLLGGRAYAELGEAAVAGRAHA
jgi:IclR family transcriptional regulator, acetate operon repressor